MQWSDFKAMGSLRSRGDSGGTSRAWHFSPANSRVYRPPHFQCLCEMVTSEKVLWSVQSPREGAWRGHPPAAEQQLRYAASLPWKKQDHGQRAQCGLRPGSHVHAPPCRPGGPSCQYRCVLSEGADPPPRTITPAGGVPARGLSVQKERHRLPGGHLGGDLLMWGIKKGSLD